MAKKIDINGLDHFKEKENAMIASEYSSSKTYAVGDYVYYAGTLYCCTTAITTAEAWTSGHWTAAKLADDCSSLKTAFIQSGIKAYVPQTVTITNSVINKTGGENAGDNFRHTVVSVQPNELYEVSGYKFSSYFPAYIFLLNGSVVFFEETVADGAFTDVKVTIPSGVDSMIVNGAAATSVVVKKYSTQEVEIKADAEKIYEQKVDKYGVTQVTPNNTTFFDDVNLFDRINSVYTHIWPNEYGVIQPNDSTRHSIIIPVEPNTTYSLRIPSPNRQIIVESTTGEFIVGQTYSVMTFLAQTTEWRVVKTAATTKSIMWHFYNGEYDYDANISGFCVLKSDTIPSDNLIPTPTVKVANLPTRVLEGKTAVIYGTSITSDALYGIPNALRSLTGMTLICESRGSSCARRGWASRETANDPYGWTGTAWQNVFLAMGASLTEKQDLIDNYETKWADLIGGDFEGANTDGTGTGKPEEINPYWEEQILSASYENKLLPYLDGTKPMPDLFIFEHGHNDYDENMSGLVTNENSLDMSTYGGAMYFYFKKIFEANPQAKIMVLSHYENTSERGKTVFDAMEQLANYHGVAFCNVADAVAWSQRLVTTTGYWDQTTHLWIPSGGTSRTITRREQALFDDLHPHNDWSGNASMREASIIADYLIANKRFLFG